MSGLRAEEDAGPSGSAGEARHKLTSTAACTNSKQAKIPAPANTHAAVYAAPAQLRNWPWAGHRTAGRPVLSEACARGAGINLETPVGQVG